eukprot:gb/GECH01010108.1/.p1 GENE.gb/GECH01010108.1/~~gb/GECH01010108.1/.p1  ORF type:complete len:159 (+),score=38.53 gb/GECH01010108.1/:1-477(+)
MVKTELHDAAFYGDFKRVKELIERSYDVNQQDDTYGVTPLHLACGKGHLSVVKLLIKVPYIDVNIQNTSWEHTPLHLACIKGYPEIVEILLKTKNININLENKRTETPFNAAIRFSKNEDILNMIKRFQECRIGFQRPQYYKEICNLWNQSLLKRKPK